MLLILPSYCISGEEVYNFSQLNFDFFQNFQTCSCFWALFSILLSVSLMLLLCLGFVNYLRSDLAVKYSVSWNCCHWPSLVTMFPVGSPHWHPLVTRPRGLGPVSLEILDIVRSDMRHKTQQIESIKTEIRLQSIVSHRQGPRVLVPGCEAHFVLRWCLPDIWNWTSSSE